MSPLSDLLQKIETLKTVANRDPAEYGKTGPAIAMAAAAAKTELVELERQYGNEILTHCVPVFIMGPLDKQTRFANIARAEFSAMIVNARQLYSDLAGPIGMSIGASREFGVEQASLLIKGLRDAGVDLKLRNLPAPKHELLPVVCKDTNAVTDYIKLAIRKADEDGLNRLVIARDAAQQALARKQINHLFPVIVLGVEDMGEYTGLKAVFGRVTEPVLITEEPTKETVAKTLTALKKQLKGAAHE